ncbi:MAG: cupin [Dehalococcoidia bacterium]|nr:cupin [Dehalococcoidia bacterium]
MLDGRGSVEVWKNGSDARSSFEYQQWSVFSVPVNANFRIINSSSSPALLLGVNSAPKVNMYQSKSFVFDNNFDFENRFGGNLEDYWKPGEDFEPQPVRGRAMITTNLIPDAATTYLPLDNNRGPGHRWLAPNMVGNTMLQGWIAEYPSGRYAKAHYAHGGGAVLVCMRGSGYTIAWPKDIAGVNPWKDGYADLVKMTEYGPGGMVSAVPGPSNWFHQHFAYSKEPFRVFNYTGSVPGNENAFGGVDGEDPGQGGEQVQASLTDIDKGGRAIPYYMEDPHIREYFTARLKEMGADFTMPEEVYTKEGSNIKVMSD